MHTESCIYSTWTEKQKVSLKGWNGMVSSNY